MRAPLLAALALGSLAACQANDESIFIEGVLIPDENCLVSSAGTVFQPSGVYDIRGARSGYSASLKVRTNLPATFNSTDVTQSKTQSPNYPNYGPVDNNVVIFDSAEVEYELQTDADTGERLEQLSDGQLSCNAGKCTIAPRTVTASGSVFNQQTTLNTASLATVELLPLDLAQSLNKLNDQLGEEGPLPSPGQRLRLIATVSLVGSTTGSGEIRKLKSFPLPHPIELCVSCLFADEADCEEYDALPILSASADLVCTLGQDRAFSTCACPKLDNAGEPVVDAAGNVVFTKPVTEADSCTEDN